MQYAWSTVHLSPRSLAISYVITITHKNILSLRTVCSESGADTYLDKEIVKSGTYNASCGR